LISQFRIRLKLFFKFFKVSNWLEKITSKIRGGRTLIWLIMMPSFDSSLGNPALDKSSWCSAKAEVPEKSEVAWYSYTHTHAHTHKCTYIQTHTYTHTHAHTSVYQEGESSEECPSRIH
jgi:hypothetical protein